MKKISLIAIIALSFASHSIYANEGRGGDRFEQLDLDKNGALTENEVKGRMKKNFAKIDTDGNEQLTKEEVKTFFSENKRKRSA